MSCGNDILKPYPNYHSCRVRDPKDFQKGKWAYKNIAHGIDMVLGRLHGETTMTTQAYRFDKDVFTAQEAKDWCKKHKINCILFEQAKAELIETFLEKIRF